MNLLKDIKNGSKEYIEYLLKYKILILVAYLVCQLGIYMLIGKTNYFIFAASFFTTIFIISSLVLMLKDSKTAILIYNLSIPILPMQLYLLNRLNQNSIGATMYFVYFIFLVIGVRKEKLNFRKINIKNKYGIVAMVYIFLSAIAIISSALSAYKFEAFRLTFIGVIFMILYSLILICLEIKEYDFYKKVILFLCIGVAISGIPDTFIALYSLILSGENIHLYGVLGSNFMLGYTLMVLPFILLYAVNKEISGKYNSIYKLLLLVEIINLCTQRSRGILGALVIAFVTIIVIDHKNYKKYLIVSLLILGCITFNVSQRGEMVDIKDSIINSGVPKVEGAGASGKGFFYQLGEQARNRSPIWSAAFRMIEDHTYIGVGPANFKYYFQSYAPELKKAYIDAHNIFLNVAAEFGIPFALVFFLSWWGAMLKALIYGFTKAKKYNKSFIFPTFIGMSSLMAYGNVTGQAFITSKHPISVVPAFVLISLLTVLLIITKEQTILKD
ncbi:O-antigen ligase family protein [Clostridium estertheticum]|uniref:O-antigen ligase family protein n=1 Tax=Clostridium estertheticum TaxID=238834 RepID=UPI0013E9425D|nr:O-antigen ligase family protein [Clostridium estertheticum]MBZ9687625.1 O-antigen ligase family protein [Clostridium estertheticum]